MSYQNFIPDITAESINRHLKKSLVFAEDCNRKYEGNVSKQGDSVRILGVGKPTITTITDKNIKLDDAETVDDSSVVMYIKQISHYNFKVDDIDKRQAVGGVMDALTQESALGVADAMDKHIAKRAADREAIKYATAAVTITKDNILTEIDKALEKLYANGVKPNSNIIMTLPPWFYMRLKQAYSSLDTNNSKMLENGRVGKYGNVTVKMSNNVHKDAADVSNIMIRTQEAIAFANPMTHVEPYRPQNGFSDAIKGFVLYDSKIVRPKELIVMNVKP